MEGWCRVREPGSPGITWEELWENQEGQFYHLQETHLSITRHWSNFGSRQKQGHWALGMMERWSHNLEAVESLPTGLASLNGQMGQNCPQAWHNSFELFFLRLKKNKTNYNFKATLWWDLFTHIYCENFEHTVKLKELYSAYPHIHRLSYTVHGTSCSKSHTHPSLCPAIHPSVLFPL